MITSVWEAKAAVKEMQKEEEYEEENSDSTNMGILEAGTKNEKLGDMNCGKQTSVSRSMIIIKK